MQEEKLNIRHNWLYSVVPVIGTPNNDGIYLVGYCKQDNKYFTVMLDSAAVVNTVILGDLDIPKDGCNPPEL